MTQQRTDEDDAAALSAIEATYAHDWADSGVVVVDGHGASIRVDRSHLVLSDGLGPFRRTRRYARATCGINRLVVLSPACSLTTQSLHWCHQVGVEVAIVDADANVEFTSVPSATNRDARLRRAQALAADTPLGHAISLELLDAKVRGSARLVRVRFDDNQAAAQIEGLADAMHETSTVDELRALEAAAASIAWSCWVGRDETSPRFASRDRTKIPDHWTTFDSRRSVLGSANGNRRAERPVNAILNYLNALAHLEATVAVYIVGLDDSFSFAHARARGRTSFALDLAEVCRPFLEAFTLDLFADRVFKRTDFAQLDDGHVRVLAPLSHELAATMPRWAKVIAPHAERVAHLLGASLDGKFTATTRLTGTNQRAAQARVRARKANETTATIPATRLQRPPEGASPSPTVTCVSCGGPLARTRHIRCADCWAKQPGQAEATRRERGRAIAARRNELEKWRSEHPDARTDPEAFRQEILPELNGVKLQEIMAATGLAKSSASMIRSGKHVPALRHWAALATLGDTRTRSEHVQQE